MAPWGSVPNQLVLATPWQSFSRVGGGEGNSRDLHNSTSDTALNGDGVRRNCSNLSICGGGRQGHSFNYCRDRAGFRGVVAPARRTTRVTRYVVCFIVANLFPWTPPSNWWWPMWRAKMPRGLQLRSCKIKWWSFSRVLGEEIWIRRDQIHWQWPVFPCVEFIINHLK